MAKIKYYCGYIHLPFEENFKTTENAVCFEVGTDVYDDSKRIEVWFPKSQLWTSKPDRTGCAEIRIPMWLIKEKGIDKNMIFGITDFIGEPDTCWMEDIGKKYRA